MVFCMISALLLGACSSSDDGEGGGGPGCDCDDDPISVENGLVLTFEDQREERPSKVSVLFKIETADGDPVPNLAPSNFTILENDQRIDPLESQRTVRTDPESFSTFTLLLLDLSGSVIQDDAKLSELKTSTEQFAEAVIPQSARRNDNGFRMGIWWFDGSEDVHSLVDFTNDQRELIAEIQRITPELSEDPSTNLYGAVIQAVRILEDAMDDAENVASGSLVIFSDGEDQAGRAVRADALDAVLRTEATFSAYTIGLGTETDVATLESLGKDGYFPAENIEALQTQFDQVASRITADANSHYFLEYCSPKRQGSHDLTIQATNFDLSGSLTTCFCASGFSSGCTIDDD